MLLTRGRIQVTDDVGFGVIFGKDEPSVRCTVWPTDDWGRWFLIWSGGWIETWVAMMDVSPGMD
jgi:hypothetical protein